MSQFTTTNDLLTDVLWRAYEQTDGSSQHADSALRYLNRAYRSLWTGGAEFMPNMPTNWWWMRSQGQIIMEVPYDTGTVSVTNDSNIATLSNAPSYSIQGYHLVVNSGTAVYKIVSHAAADVGLILDTVYVGDTDTALDFTAVLIDYALPDDCLKIIDPMVAHVEPGARIYGVDMSEMWDQFPIINLAEGTPRLYAPIDEDNIRFSHYTDEMLRFDFFYLAEPDDLTTDPDSAPVMPVNYRHTLADMACFFVLTDKEEERAPGIGAQAKAGIAAMAAENRKRWGDAGLAGMIYPRSGNRKTWVRSMSGLRLWWGR